MPSPPIHVIAAVFYSPMIASTNQFVNPRENQQLSAAIISYYHHSNPWFSPKKRWGCPSRPPSPSPNKTALAPSVRRALRPCGSRPWGTTGRELVRLPRLVSESQHLGRIPRNQGENIGESGGNPILAYKVALETLVFRNV